MGDVVWLVTTGLLTLSLLTLVGLSLGLVWLTWVTTRDGCDD
jgi:hypothetical protein